MAYKPANKNVNTGESRAIDIGTVTGIGYKRDGVDNDVNRFRLIEKVYVDGIKYQLNGTLTEIKSKK